MNTKSKIASLPVHPHVKVRAWLTVGRIASLGDRPPTQTLAEDGHVRFEWDSESYRAYIKVHLNGGVFGSVSLTNDDDVYERVYDATKPRRALEYVAGIMDATFVDFASDEVKLLECH